MLSYSPVYNLNLIDTFGNATFRPGFVLDRSALLIYVGARPEYFGWCLHDPAVFLKTCIRVSRGIELVRAIPCELTPHNGGIYLLNRRAALSLLTEGFARLNAEPHLLV